MSNPASVQDVEAEVADTAIDIPNDEEMGVNSGGFLADANGETEENVSGDPVEGPPSVIVLDEVNKSSDAVDEEMLAESVAMSTTAENTTENELLTDPSSGRATRRSSAQAYSAMRAMLEPVKAEPMERSSRRLSRGNSLEFEDVPVVTLSREEELIDTADGLVAPATTLEGVSSSLRKRVRKIDVEAALVRQGSDLTFLDSVGDEEDPTAGQVRTALFISARVFRTDPEDDLGFKIKVSDNNTLAIAEVMQDGLLARSPVLEGDTLISINNKNCFGMKLPGAQKLIKNITGHVTVTVQNADGDNSLVECYIRIPDNKRKIGLNLVNEAFHRDPGMRSVQSGPLITSVHSNGLAVDSLLNPGDQIIAVNGKSVSNIRSAMIAFSNVKSHVTILARTKQRTAMVVTTQPEEGTRSRMFDFYGTPASARRLRRDDPSRSSAYDSLRMTSNIIAVILCIIVLAFPANTGFFIAGRNWAFAVLTIFSLANASWYCRTVGSRFSKLQLACNLILISYILYIFFGTDETIRIGWFCAVYIPLLGLVNLPSCIREGEGNDVDIVGGSVGGDSDSFDEHIVGPATSV